MKIPTRLGPVSTLLFASIFALGCGDAKEKNVKPAPPTVQVAAPLQQTMPVYAQSIGLLESSDTVEIRARVAGFLSKISFKDGAMVKAGDPLFTIDPRPFQAALESAQAQLAQSEATLANAKKDLPRYRNLVKVRAVSKQQLDNVETTYLKSIAERQAAVAALDNAKLNLEYTHMVSPISGKIGRAEMKVGALVQVGTSLLATVSRTDSMFVNFSMSEKDYLDLSKSDAFKAGNLPSVELFLADGSVYAEKGVLDFRDRAVDQQTGTIAFRATVPNPDGSLLPGGYAQVRIKISDGKDTLLVSQRAVIETQGATSIWVLDENKKPKLVDVTVGRRLGSLWEITKGVDSNQQVIVEGIQKLKADMPVRTEQIAMKENTDHSESEQITTMQSSAEKVDDKSAAPEAKNKK